MTNSRVAEDKIAREALYHFQPVFSDGLARPSLISVCNAAVSPERSRSGINSAFSRVFFLSLLCSLCRGGRTGRGRSYLSVSALFRTSVVFVFRASVSRERTRFGFKSTFFRMFFVACFPARRVGAEGSARH